MYFGPSSRGSHTPHTLDDRPGHHSVTPLTSSTTVQLVVSSTTTRPGVPANSERCRVSTAVKNGGRAVAQYLAGVRVHKHRAPGRRPVSGFHQNDHAPGQVRWDGYPNRFQIGAGDLDRGQQLVCRLSSTDRFHERQFWACGSPALFAEGVTRAGDGHDEQHRAGDKPRPEVPPPHAPEEQVDHDSNPPRTIGNTNYY